MDTSSLIGSALRSRNEPRNTFLIRGRAPGIIDLAAGSHAQIEPPSTLPSAPSSAGRRTTPAERSNAC